MGRKKQAALSDSSADEGVGEVSGDETESEEEMTGRSSKRGATAHRSSASAPAAASRRLPRRASAKAAPVYADLSEDEDEEAYEKVDEEEEFEEPAAGEEEEEEENDDDDVAEEEEDISEDEELVVVKKSSKKKRKSSSASSSSRKTKSRKGSIEPAEEILLEETADEVEAKCKRLEDKLAADIAAYESKFGKGGTTAPAFGAAKKGQKSQHGGEVVVDKQNAIKGLSTSNLATILAKKREAASGQPTPS
jgi:hypothetical protein